MAGRRFGAKKVPGRGIIWLLAAVLALALAGLGLEHGGGSPVPVNSVLSSHQIHGSTVTGGTTATGASTVTGESDVQPSTKSGDDANHTDNDCDTSQDQAVHVGCTPKGHHNPPPPKCGHDNEKLEGLHGKENAQEEHQEHEACKISGQH